MHDVEFVLWFVRFYVACDGCDGWFHGQCVGVTPNEANKLKEYFCPSCIVAHEQNSKQDCASLGSKSKKKEDTLAPTRLTGKQKGKEMTGTSERHHKQAKEKNSAMTAEMIGKPAKNVDGKLGKDSKQKGTADCLGRQKRHAEADMMIASPGIDKRAARRNNRRPVADVSVCEHEGENEELTSTRKRRGKSAQELYCVCRQPYDESR